MNVDVSKCTMLGAKVNLGASGADTAAAGPGP